jgi:hypothetical protein
LYGAPPSPPKDSYEAPHPHNYEASPYQHAYGAPAPPPRTPPPPPPPPPQTHKEQTKSMKE